MSTENRNQEEKSNELYTLLGTRAKVRMWQIDSVLTGISYRIEVKKWYGWVQPSISYSEDGHFFNKQEAEKWFEYLSGKKDKKKLIAWA
jgi:hypothetical protein